MTDPDMSQPVVAVAVATYRRDHELRRLLDALAASLLPVTGKVYVADNAHSSTTAKVCQSAPLPCEWLPVQENSGPGPAWNCAIRAALADNQATHVLVLDDDVVPPPETVSVLLNALEISGAAVAAPLLFDTEDKLWGFPEPKEVELRLTIRRVHTKQECLTAFGTSPHPFCWATGACLLYTRRALEQAGMFREDFWMLGEDLELSMRAAANLGGVFTAAAAVPHLPPPAADSANASRAHRAKFLALLQNLSYLSFHSPHRAHLPRYLPGNFRRYLRTERISLPTLREAWSAFCYGAVRAQPAGGPLGQKLRQRAAQR
jgi:GT2 family glycosyltransferase